MIKVLHIHTLPVISGSGINTFLSMKGMDGSRYSPELACAPDGSLIDLVRENNMKVSQFEHLVQPLHPLKDFLALLDLIKYLRKSPFHIVHTHNSKAGFLGRLAAKLSGVPVIIHTVHGFSFHDKEPPWRRFLFKNIERLAAHWCHSMIFISQPLIEWARREKIGSEEQYIKIYSGIELDRFKPASRDEKNRVRKVWRIRQKDAVIGIVSKLWEGKGHENLIDAFGILKKELKDAKLVIVGEGYLYDKLVLKVHRSGLEGSVIFTGFQEDVSEIIAAFDVAVLPSFFEGMGRVILEAMAMEKPVVASNVGGIPDLVVNGANGFLVPPGNTPALAKTIMKVLKNKKLATQLGKKGREMATVKFSSEKMINSIENVYQGLLRKKGINFDH